MARARSRRLQDLEILHSLGQELGSTLEIDRLLDGALERIMRATGADVAAIRTIDRATGETVLRAQRGVPDSYLTGRQRLAPGAELPGQVIRTGQPVVIPDLRKARGVSTLLEHLPRLRSLVAIPLWSKGELSGSLSLGSFRVGRFAPSRLTFLSAAAGLLGAALENADLYAAARQNAAREEERGQALEALLEAARIVTAEHDLDRVLRRIAETARELARARYAALGVVGPGGVLGRFIPVGLTPEEIARIGELPRGRGVLGVMLQHGKSLRLSDLSRHPGAVGFPPAHPPMRTFLGVPIFARGRLLGSLYMADKEGGLRFTADDERLLNAFAAHAGIALENAALLERERAAAAAQAELNRFREEMFASLSHDMRTPLSTLQMACDALSMPGWSEEDRDEFLTTGRLEVERLTRMVNDLLDLTRIDRGRLSLDLASVALADLVRAAVRGAELKAHGKGIALSVQVAAALPSIVADRAKLERVMGNLLTNAVAYTPPGGSVSVAARPADAGGIEVAVTDTGTGIPPEVLPRVFERFFRANPAGRSAGAGTGLGLFICKSFVEAHGGRIWAESGAGRGTTIRFTLPSMPPGPPGAVAA
jgi:signal transduction histidine kinase